MKTLFTAQVVALRQPSRAVLALSLMALIIGVLLPGYWRDAIEAALVPRRLHFSSLMHLLLFALSAAALCCAPFRWPRSRILISALLLALLTEGLQHFVVGRHPRLRDVGIDLTGAVLGLCSVLGWQYIREEVEKC